MNRFRFGLWLALIMVMTRNAGAQGFTVSADGVYQRTIWNDSRIVGSPEPPSPYRAVRDFPNLKLHRPIYVRPEPGTDRIFVVTVDGNDNGPASIRSFVDRPDADQVDMVLESNRLIYGFTFHPRYVENRYVYVIWNGPSTEKNRQNRITRFTVTRDSPPRLDPESELTILEWDSNGHNGGDLAFGPDGYLYCPTGDGTSDSDTLVTGQGLNDLLAVLLRIDVDHPSDDKPYSVPADNPYVGTEGARPEIWATGFRNPWRMDYDHRQNQLWVTQNGQDLWEQVYFVRKGDNFGWSVFEGSHPFYLERTLTPEPHALPAAEHHHSEARSLTGGVVYWGDALPDLRGAYIYGDYSTGKIWSVRHDGERTTWNEELVDTSLQIAGFGPDHDGELMIVDIGGGIYRLEPNTEPDTQQSFPRRLSETGLFTDVARHAMNPALLPYDVNVELWSDGAHKERWLAIPGEGKITFRENRGWNLPEGTVLVKSFALEREAGRAESRRWIETRLLMRQQGEWVGYSYLWNDEQTDAVLVDKQGRDMDYEIRDAAAPGGVRRQSWHYPARAECMVCHSRAANYVLGISTAQFNRVHGASDGELNQIELLQRLDMFDAELPESLPEMERLAALDDDTASLDRRARSYLHANCSFCHVEAGGGNSAVSFEIIEEPEKARLIDGRPVHATFDLSEARIVAPGNPDRSLVLYRMERRGKNQMPPLASAIVDDKAVKLLRKWIESLEPASQ